ncbi:MAG: alpha-glucosidase [Myxococcales bacterium]
MSTSNSKPDVPWWRRTTVYQIYPRSFADQNGDGIGDLAGIIERLDYLHDLGVETLWISPFFASPQADFGYDISDYLSVSPEYGSEADLGRLIAEVHARGMKIVFDMVMNHTSNQHAWFLESRATRQNPKRDWYIWRDGRDPGGRAPPNNWQCMLGGTGWQYDAATEQWYWASFLPFQPDLNYRNPEVKAMMLGIVRHWLALGVDGFRLDIFNAIYKDSGFHDNPFSLRFLPAEDNPDGFFQHHLHTIDHADTLRFARELRGVVDEFQDPPRFLVGEVFGSPDSVRRYCGDQADGLHLVFLFKSMRASVTRDSLHSLVEEFERVFPEPFLPTWVFSNHDRPRMLHRLGDDLRKARLLATLQLTARGVPFIYYGEEIGMRHSRLLLGSGLDPLAQRNRRVPEFLARVLSQRGLQLNRDECRLPMQWTDGPNAGFCPSLAKPWLPVHASSEQVNVAAQRAQPDSLLQTYRGLLALRKRSRALQQGELSLFSRADLPSQVFGYRRRHGEENVDVYFNASTRPATLRLAQRPGHLFSSLRVAHESTPEAVRLEPYEAVVLSDLADAAE